VQGNNGIASLAKSGDSEEAAIASGHGNDRADAVNRVPGISHIPATVAGFSCASCGPGGITGSTGSENSKAAKARVFIRSLPKYPSHSV
jgi:hypothetical protein